MSATITRAVPSGAWIISDIVGGYLVTRTYYGHTKRDALQLFREHVKATA
jgi:hypothetical protein